jgi:hypothetical protein
MMGKYDIHLRKDSSHHYLDEVNQDGLPQDDEDKCTSVEISEPLGTAYTQNELFRHASFQYGKA